MLGFLLQRAIFNHVLFNWIGKLRKDLRRKPVWFYCHTEWHTHNTNSGGGVHLKISLKKFFRNLRFIPLNSALSAILGLVGLLIPTVCMTIICSVRGRTEEKYRFCLKHVSEAVELKNKLKSWRSANVPSFSLCCCWWNQIYTSMFMEQVD